MSNTLLVNQQLENEVVGVSDTLLNDFDMLREIETEHGHKFTNKTVNTLARHLVCRHYANLCYEFAHFNWAILHSQGLGSASASQFLQYYWIENGSSPKASKIFFQKSCTKDEHSLIQVSEQNSVRINDKSIVIQIFEHQFSIFYSRANLLACFMEWLISILPNFLERIEQALLGKSVNAIKAFASDLQKSIYEYLLPHLPAVKLQQRYRKLHHYFQQHKLDDDGILQCWQQLNTEEGFIKFSGLLIDTFTFIEANELAKVQSQLSFADDIEQDLLSKQQQDNHHLSSFFELFENNRSLAKIHLSMLEKPVKALAKKQIDFLHLIADFPNFVHSLTKSYMRWQVFGKYQHQVIQALRAKIQVENWPNIEEDYVSFTQNCVDLLAANQQSLLAIVHILLPRYPIESVQVITQLSEELPQFNALPSQLAELISRNQINMTELANLQAYKHEAPLIEKFIHESRLAFKLINRQGFTTHSIASLEDYLIVVESLFKINRLLKGTLKRILKENWQQESNFDADRHIFMNEFIKLHVQDTHE